MTNASPHGAHKWQTPKARAASGRPAKGRSRRPLVIAILFTMLVLGGALVALLFYRQEVPDALLVIARVDQYDDDQLPISPWGDTDRSVSNISTTTLVWAAFGAVPGATTKNLILLGSDSRIA